VKLIDLDESEKVVAIAPAPLEEPENGTENGEVAGENGAVVAADGEVTASAATETGTLIVPVTEGSTETSTETDADADGSNGKDE
jgi:hypothetical protein